MIPSVFSAFPGHARRRWPLLGWRSVARICALVAGLALAGSACSLNTLGAPSGPLTLTANFDDVSGLVEGHTVQTANVIIGSVRKIELNGYRAKVTMSITDGHPIPKGTKALIKRTSLLGEHYVDLDFPDDYNPDTAQFFASGEEIPDTGGDPELEDLANQAGELVSAVTSDDLSVVVQAGYQALAGKGGQLNKITQQLSQIVGVLGNQTSEVAATIDNLGTLTSSLAPLSDTFGTLLDSIDATTVNLLEDRDKFFTVLSSFNDLASTVNDVILVPHFDQYTNLLHEAQAVLQSLNDNRATLESLADNFARFVPLIDTAISRDQLLVAVWGELDDQHILPSYMSQLMGA